MPATPPTQLVLDEDAVPHPQLADAPARHLVDVSRHAHETDNTIAAMSAPGIFRPPAAVNEPVRSYAPGSPERAELQERLAQMAGERIHIPLVIGGERVETGTTFEAVMPHRRDHVLADVEKGGAAEVERAIAAARAATRVVAHAVARARRDLPPRRRADRRARGARR